MKAHLPTCSVSGSHVDAGFLWPSYPMPPGWSPRGLEPPFTLGARLYDVVIILYIYIYIYTHTQRERESIKSSLKTNSNF